ncbi:hypothetical protein CDD81_7655 [Ophiocordyceps australis]|uniref:MARVEL domain-containing protein n=1 Tax=Ophiocordyceps australis TaxID=1399860 RepID=A0A2C5Y576_9HYPO|nr:hypothetical protein CDD81_7655 [Ophiocordyceps australis]
MAAQAMNDKRRPAALDLTSKRSASSVSTSSTNSLKVSRTPRFAEATSINSPAEATASPFADPDMSQPAQSQPGEVGFGYIANQDGNPESVMAPKSPLRSAIKAPGTPARHLANPLSPTFCEEEALEKREQYTEKEQERDVRMKTRVRMAKFALRGVSFSCSLIILSMLSASFAIFNSTRSLPNQSNMPSWAPNTNQKSWPQKLSLAMSCLSLFVCVLVLLAYCKGGHKRAEKVNTYYTMFAIGWFIVSMILWVVTAALLQHARDHSNNKDMWGWACVDNNRADVFSQKVDYQLVCRLQNWALVCIIIEVVIEAISIALYSLVFYRYYTKRRLFKSMDLRDRARSDLYLAQLRSQSAPNTPGFAGPRSPALGPSPKSPALSHYAMSPRHPPAAYRNLSDVKEASPFTPGGRIIEPPSQFSHPQPSFKLQPPPAKAPAATPKQRSATISLSPSTATSSEPPSVTATQRAPKAADEPTYEAVPIPGAYAAQAAKSS